MYKHEDTQEYVIERFAAKIGIPRDELKRPDPFAMIYAVALHLAATEKLKGKGNGERLLKTKYHWSDLYASVGDFVFVGGALIVTAWVSSGICVALFAVTWVSVFRGELSSPRSSVSCF